jgi:hypothetical protein
MSLELYDPAGDSPADQAFRRSAFRKLVTTMTSNQLVRLISTLERDDLEWLEKEYGYPACSCPVRITPCYHQRLRKVAKRMADGEKIEMDEIATLLILPRSRHLRSLLRDEIREWKKKKWRCDCHTVGRIELCEHWRGRVTLPDLAHAFLLWRLSPREYRERKALACETSSVIWPQDYAVVMAERQERGEALRHPGDWRMLDVPLDDDIKRAAPPHLKNGSDASKPTAIELRKTG